MASVSLKNVSKSFGNTQIIENLNLEIKDKEFLVLVGPSGCGKSTLLRMVAGLEDITSGDISIGDRVVNHTPPKDRNIAMVFQNYALYPHMNVFENISFGLRAAKMPKREIEHRVKQVAEILELDELMFRKPSELSGGERQRVSMGRAIVRDPSVFLFDEPLSNLDAKLRATMRAEIKKLHHTVATTMIYVTHDQVEAMTLADRIVILKDGLIQQIGTPMDVYNNPANQFVAGFIGSPEMNFIKSPKDVAKGCITMGIRPEDISLVTDGATPPDSAKKIKGEISLIEPLGAETLITINYHDTPITAKLPGLVTATVGEQAKLALNMQKAFLFNEKGERV